MTLKRPDLGGVPPHIIAYIDVLETEIKRLSRAQRSQSNSEAPPSEPSEPPTTMNLITLSQGGLVKRTPRHHYPRQRRGGMGIFDLETSEDDPPGLLIIADEADTLVLVTDQGRIFHVAVASLPEGAVRARGESLSRFVLLPPDEKVAFAAPLQGEGAVALVSARGYVRVLRHNYMAESVRPGTQLMDVRRFGAVAAGSWVDESAEVFIATQGGQGIRFAAKRVHPNGSLGLRLERGDMPIAITSVTDESGVFLLSHDGKGSIRLMSGFRSNKSPGSGGKIALKTDKLVAAMTVQDDDDIFIISQLSKVIRFQANEIPLKEGTVQGVNCMALRADECVAAVKC